MQIDPSNHLVLGTKCFSLLPPVDAARVLDRAVARNLHHIDTSNVYDGRFNALSTLSNWMKDRCMFGQIKICLKLGIQCEGERRTVNLSLPSIYSSLVSSLKILHLDFVDCLVLHSEELGRDPKAVVDMVSTLQTSGLIKAWAFSNFSAFSIERLLSAAKAAELQPPEFGQLQWNFVERSIEREHLAVLRYHNVQMMAWAPFCDGLLAKDCLASACDALLIESKKNRWKDYVFIHRTLQEYYTIAKAIGIAPPALALTWLLASHPHLRIVFGASSPEQVDTNVAALANARCAVFAIENDTMLGYPYDGIRRLNYTPSMKRNNRNYGN